jgi:hypothetical protein
MLSTINIYHKNKSCASINLNHSIGQKLCLGIPNVVFMPIHIKYTEEMHASMFQFMTLE